jgi:uncharacterized repeat protein (TIGR03803 family)
MSPFSRIALCAVFVAGLICFLHPARAETFNPLYSFCQTIDSKFHCDDGAVPASRLLQVGADFYGTTSSGGTPNSGTIFRITPAGVFKQLYSFCVQADCPDGAPPGRYLARGPDGEIYGTTPHYGGLQTAGTIFKMSTAGELKTVYNFCSQKNCLDGSSPVAVLFDKAGNLFGTTTAGGKFRFGTIFEITANGAFVKLHDFCSSTNCDDGFQPGALILGRDGDLYGTTSAGGAKQNGTAFRISPTGQFTILHAFCAIAKCPDGGAPTQKLVEGRDGNFYGITGLYGANHQGTVYQLTPAGKLTTIHAFCARPYCDDGSAPGDGLTLGADGSFYGVTGGGGSYYGGVLFNITTSGDYKIVHYFCALHGCFDGSGPVSAPTLVDGKLYGMTLTGGAKFNVGELYSLTP